MSQWVLSVDPGANCGVALFRDKVFVTAGTADGTTFTTLVACIQSLLKSNSLEGKREAVIEAGYIGGNIRTSLVLERRRGLVQAACEYLGFAIAELYPSAWQNRCLRHLSDGAAGRPKRAQLKKRSLIRASEICGKTVTSSDIADAVCMGYVYANGFHLPGVVA